MKKRTKITLRKKIYLTIVGLLALTGILYASNPFPFSSGVPFPTGVAASTDQLLVTPYCDDIINQIDCTGTATFFANIPGFGSCREKYMTFAPFSLRRPGSTRAMFSSYKALWSSRSIMVPPRCLRGSRGASHRTTTGLPSTILAPTALT
jgi:hypothetical protein